MKIFKALTAATLILMPLVSIGADTATNARSTASKDGPNRFYGPISKVDTNKNSFTVGDQTFVITAETQIVNKDGEKAKLSDAVVGEPARGSYTKKSDGTLDVTKVRFGKKSNTKGSGSGKGTGKKKSADSSETKP